MLFTSFLPKFVRTLLEGSNTEHNAVLGAIKAQMELLETDLDLFYRELTLVNSTGGWLDEWGSWFGVFRVSRESDAVYVARIVDSLNQEKNTIPSIKNIVARYLTLETGITFTANDIIIFEPYEGIKVFSQRGEFSGVHRFPNATYWRRNVIDIKLPDGVALTETLERAVNKVKSAGIKVWFSAYPVTLLINEVGDNTDIINEDMRVFPGRVTDQVSGNIHNVVRGKFSGEQELWQYPETY